MTSHDQDVDLQHLKNFNSNRIDAFIFCEKLKNFQMYIVICIKNYVLGSILNSSLNIESWQHKNLYLQLLHKVDFTTFHIFWVFLLN
jgi:hypothetical protein